MQLFFDYHNSSPVVQFYVDGKEGIMLIETESLRVFLSPPYANLTSEKVFENVWKKEGRIFSLIPKTSFISCQWSDLPHMDYGVISYQWKTKLEHIVKFALGVDGSPNPMRSKYIWLDIGCLNQLDGNRMTTIQRSDEIYYHAKEYHLIEVGSLRRGWVLLELSSVPKTLIPITHFTTSDANMLNMAKATFKRGGFEGCKFSKESDRILVRKKILEKYEDMQAFNNKIAAIVDTLL